MAPTLPNSGIKVSTDGVKLGWSVLATLASIGLGLYVAMVITPLKKDLETVASDMDTCKKTQNENGTILIKHIAAMEEGIRNRERRLEFLERKIEQLEHTERAEGHLQYSRPNANITNKSTAP